MGQAPRADFLQVQYALDAKLVRRRVGERSELQDLFFHEEMQKTEGLWG